MGYWREELKDNPDLYRAYANLLDASENNVAAFEREVLRQGLWEEYQCWRKTRGADSPGEGAEDKRVVFAAGKKIISSVVAMLKGKEEDGGS